MMTIAAGFVCSDGILLASDTLYSGAVQRTYGQKLWILHDDDPVVVFGGASDSVAALTRARDEISRKLKRGMSFQRTLDTIDTALQKVDAKFRTAGAWGPDIQALVAIRAESKTRLYANAPTKVALSPVDDPTVCVGVDSLGDYFAKALFRGGMPLRWAKVVAAHLVWNCKEYASGYCGGETNLVEVPLVGTPAFIGDQNAIRDYEGHLAGINRAMQIVLPDGRANDSTLLERAKLMRKYVEELERQFFLHATAGELTISAPRLSATVVVTKPETPPQDPEG